VDTTPELLVAEPCFVERTGGCCGDVFPENRKCLPKSEGLESENNRCVGPSGYIADEFEIFAQALLFEHVGGVMELAKSLQIYLHISIF
jgi:hypothetical protein